MVDKIALLAERQCLYQLLGEVKELLQEVDTGDEAPAIITMTSGKKVQVCAVPDTWRERKEDFVSRCPSEEDVKILPELVKPTSEMTFTEN